jgi:hypothetical protein
VLDLLSDCLHQRDYKHDAYTEARPSSIGGLKSEAPRMMLQVRSSLRRSSVFIRRGLFFGPSSATAAANRMQQVRASAICLKVISKTHEEGVC